MLARLQRLIAYFLVGIALAAACLALRFDAAVFWLLPGFVVGGYAATLATEFLLLRRSYDAGDGERPSLRQLTQLWPT